MTDNTFVQGDLFGFLSPEEQTTLTTTTVENEKRKQRKNQLSMNKPATKKENITFETLEVNLETHIKYDGELTPITQYFSNEEIEQGIEDPEAKDGRRTINTEDLRLKLAEEYGEMSDRDYVTLTLFPNNLIIPQVHGRKRGASTGVFTSLKEAAADRKYNMYVPSADGHVYHIRDGEVYSVCTKASYVPVCDQLHEGIQFKLPPIPYIILEEFISLCREYSKDQLEIYGEIYFHHVKGYHLSIPHQVVSSENVVPEKTEIDDAQMIKVMELHSHHTLEITPSEQDNNSEIGRCLYTIIGRLDCFFPKISCRVFVDGQYQLVDLNKVFTSPFPPATNAYDYRIQKESAL
ncbi:MULTISPECIES: hypothetical protein [Paenibacillus]|uniref:JAB domain-containing protein n=1 Tax=Paenibacillus vandeheii TaxID=3035917 RepID=A0ABT8JH18_9BACL|nr:MULTISPECIES: hypothetical protein [Paenibacillus]KGP81955.1 hypothetical protein P364_0114125 [Paenibacillus sp. MAEPY2]KGP86041.1 hypothetical protein P363_0119600 [Paenibacillus sp. MAEPY1]MDN4603871.1 hypothetical protein [Paenibacillus vandeheii]